MTNRTTLHAAFVTLLVVPAMACTGASHAGEQHVETGRPAPSVGPAADHAHHEEHAPAPAGPLSGSSVYHLDDVWVDHHGAERRLVELRGTPQVVAMVYTNCGSACPRIVADMKRLESEVPAVGFVLVSIDPDRDTPGQLDSFARATRLSERWTLLAGRDESIATLAAVLGVRYRRVSATDFMHSNVITVLNADGSIAYRQESVGEIEGTIAALRRMNGAR